MDALGPASSLAALALLAACASRPRPPAVGDEPLDLVRLDETPELAYLQKALGEPGLRVADLFRADPPAFRAAPDPSPLLLAHRAANPLAPASGSASPLTVLTWNVALLDAKVFGFIKYSRSPFLEERCGRLPAVAPQGGFDVVLLQEVWRAADVERFRTAAEAAGYRVFVGPRDDYDDGLLLLVRSEALGTEPPVVEAVPYADSDSLEYFPGPWIRRGFLAVRFTHPRLGPVVAYDTHLLAWPGNWPIRMRQARQLALHARAAAATGALVVLGGDLNAGSYYLGDDWKDGKGKSFTGWWANTQSYALLSHYGGLKDLFLMGRTEEEALRDVEYGRAVVNAPDEALTVPGGAPGWCESHYGRNFTATDCNRLYFLQYAGTERPARMDHLFVGAPEGRVHVERSAILFSERGDYGAPEPTEPSDHLGVAVWMQVKPPAAR